MRMRRLHAEPAPYESVNELLDAIRAQEKCESENQLAIAMEWSPSKLRNYRKGRSRPDDAEAIQIARKLNIHEGMVLAICHAERCEQNAPERRVWLYVAKSLSRMTAAAVAVGLIGTSTLAPAPAPTGDAGGLYILLNGRRRLIAGGAPPGQVPDRRRRLERRRWPRLALAA
jgi:hypothetical protein